MPKPSLKIESVQITLILLKQNSRCCGFFEGDEQDLERQKMPSFYSLRSFPFARASNSAVSSIAARSLLTLFPKKQPLRRLETKIDFLIPKTSAALRFVVAPLREASHIVPTGNVNCTFL